jgi:ribosome maturation factor RimP
MWGMLPTFFCSDQSPRRNVNDELESVVTQELEAVGFDLVELRRGGTRSRPSLDDCARVSRALEARLDAGGIVSERYVLQVSSPGDRPLRTSAEWRRFVGRWINVLSPAQGGRYEGKLLGIEGDEGAEVAVLDMGKGQQRHIPLADVKEARLAFHL